MKTQRAVLAVLIAIAHSTSAQARLVPDADGGSASRLEATGKKDGKSSQKRSTWG